jgi:hypothetical protein
MPAKRSPFKAEVASGDRGRALLALRDRLADELTSAEGAAVASLARQLVLVLGELDGIKSPEVSARDDLASRRTARRAAAQVQGGAAGGDVGGPGSG